MIIDSLLEDLGNIFTGSVMKTFGIFVKTLIVKLTRIKMVKIKKNLGLTKTVNLPDKNIANLRDVIS